MSPLAGRVTASSSSRGSQAGPSQLCAAEHRSATPPRSWRARNGQEQRRRVLVNPPEVRLVPRLSSLYAPPPPPEALALSAGVVANGAYNIPGV
jgi:hypothetical protein